MIDTEQFNGHTPGPWDYESGEDIWAEDRLICRMSLSHSERPHYRATNADARLIAAAPDLLAEVKRLRDKITLLERAEAHWYSMVADELDGDYPND